MPPSSPSLRRATALPPGRTARRRYARLAAVALSALAACAEPPPPAHLAPPAATEGAARPATLPALAPGHRFVGLRVSLPDPPPDLLDGTGAGVIALRRRGDEDPVRLVFLNGALGVYALRPGAYRVTSVAGYVCEGLDIVVPERGGPLFLGDLTLTAGGEAGSVAGTVPSPGDLRVFAELFGGDPAAVGVDPLARGGPLPCRFAARAVSRPDIDPTVYRMTPWEKVQMAATLAMFAGLTAGAAAVGTVVFVSGAGGGLLFLAY